MKNSMEISLKIRNKSTIWPNNPTTGHIAQENHNFKRYMYSNVHCSTIYISQDLEATKRPLKDEWIKKMWYMYTVKYYSTLKRMNLSWW